MTLGELIEFLEKQDRALVLPEGFANPHSYRGYYDELAFEPAGNVTVGAMLEAARSAAGSAFQGWKGGEYVMSDYTECWLATRGSTGEGIGPLLLRLMIAAGTRPARLAPEPPMLSLYRDALERLADEDTPVLGEGLGGGPAEELHVRASFAAHTLGRDTCGCTECMVSLGLDPDDEDGPAEAGEASRRDALDAQPSGDLAARLRAVLLDLRTNPTEARIQALHLLDDDEQRAADLRAHVAGMGGPSPAWVTDNAAGVRPGNHDDQAERDDVLRMRREMAREAGDDSPGSDL